MVKWLLEETHDQEITSSNPATRYYLDNSSHLFAEKCVSLVGKTHNK